MKFRMFFSIAALLVAGFAFGTGVCVEDTTMVARTQVAPIAFADSTNLYVGNYFPWTINTSYFATFRNQYLYPASQFPSEARSVESIASRSVSFLGSQTGVYEDPGSVGWSYLQILGFYGGHPGFGTRFATNRVGGELFVDYFDENLGTYPITDVSPYNPLLEITTGGYSDISYGLPGFTPIPWSGSPANDPTMLLDSGMDLSSSGHSGNVAWDMAQAQDCWRAYGSASYYNSNWLTTAYGIDDAAFVWVFQGLAGAPPATLDANIKEIVRLLLTPEALRCSDLDTNVDGGVHDDPIMFPGGKDIDPVSPQVTTNAPLHMEEEENPNIRPRNFRP